MTAGGGEATVLLVLGALFLMGLAADLAGRFSPLPRVTLLLLGGLALGPAGAALLPAQFVAEWFDPMTTIALALIGFLLGHQLSVANMRRHGARIVALAVAKMIGAWLVVSAALVLAGADPLVALLLGGIAPATDPAATYDVVHERRDSGEFADSLLSVVALDDGLGLVLFIAILIGAGAMAGDASIAAEAVAGLREIGGSIALGVTAGLPMAYLSGRIQPGEPTIAEALGFVLLGAGLAEWLGCSPILTSMVMGYTVASTAKHHERPFHAIEGIEWPFMILFFVLAGASLDVAALPAVGALTVVYIVARTAGTYAGTRLGARLTGASPAVRRWLGLALLPQAGIAIGMALLASQRFPEVASVVLPVALASTVVLEIVSPIITRYALRSAQSSHDT